MKIGFVALKKGIGLMLVLVAAAMAVVACGGEDRPGSVSVDPSSDTPSVSGTGAGPGTVEPKPEGAEEVDVTLGEWTLTPDRNTVPAGEVYFHANNVGPNDPHELVIIRTDLAPDALPTVDGKVPEDQVDLVGEIEPFSPGTDAASTFNLTPGSYVLICNITEIEDGELESHYEQGMRTAFTVE